MAFAAPAAAAAAPAAAAIPFLGPFMLAATAIGAGVTAYSQYQAGQAQARQFRYQQQTNQQLAQIALGNANYDIASGGLKAEQAGLVSRGIGGRFLAGAGARNIGPTTGSTARIYMSQNAIGMENEKIQIADAAHAAYGEEVQAAEKTATAGAMGVAGSTAVTAGDIGAVGSIVSGVGSVAGKWYQIAQQTPTGAAGGGPLNILEGADTTGGGAAVTNPTQQSSWNWNA